MKKFAVLALLPLAACIRFGAEPPPSLLALSPATAVPVGDTRTASATTAVTITAPATPQELAVTRVPVRATDTTIAYVKDAQWVEPPARLFARLLGDTITTRTGRVILTGRQSLVDPGAQLSGDLRSFGIEAATSEAVVTYDASLLRGAGTAVERRRFEARVPVATIDAASVGPALNQAANQVAGEVADWVGR